MRRRDGERTRAVLIPPADPGRKGEAPQDQAPDTPTRPASSIGVPLSIVLPGLPQLLAGRVMSGGYGLAIWVGVLALVVARWDRVWAAAGGPLDHQVAVVGAAAVLAGVWGWSLRDVRRGATTSPRPGESWGRVARSFGRNRLALWGAGVVATLSLVALLAPLAAPFDPNLQGDLMTRRLVGPSGEHLLGTDQYARDILSRLLFGARISLVIGFLAVGIAVGLGTLVGLVAGFSGGRVDGVLMRCVDMVISFPRLVLLIAVVALFGPSLTLIVVILGLTQWPHVARIVRGEVLSVREREFVEAARALGFSRTRTLARHILPNVAGPIVVAATLGVGDTIVLEAVLSFLGLGVQPPTPSWGMMVAEGRSHLLGAWWISTFSGLAIVVTVLSLNLAGDGLRDVMDPRMKR